MLCYIRRVAVAKTDGQENLNTAHSLSDINREQETTATCEGLNEDTATSCQPPATTHTQL